MIGFTTDEDRNRRAWLHDILVWAQFLSVPKRSISVGDYAYMYGGNNANFSEGQEYAKTIVDFILKRPVRLEAFKKVDEALTKLVSFAFLPALSSTINTPPIRKSSTMLAYYVATFCAENELYFDVSNSSKYEVEELTKHTLIGKALFDMECFTHQAAGSTGKMRVIGNGAEEKPQEQPKAAPQPQTAAQPTAQAAPTAQPTAQPQQPAQPAAKPQAGANGKKPPKNDYKSLGGLSDRVTGLVGKPHEKTTIVDDLYCIACDDANGNRTEDTAYIRPLDDKYVDKANNKSIILYGKAKGYGYLPIYSPYKSYMDTIAQLMTDDLNKNPNYSKLKNNISKIYVAKKHPSKDGYFEMHTNANLNVFVSASKLNEELEEDLDENLIEDSSISIPVDLFEKHLMK